MAKLNKTLNTLIGELDLAVTLAQSRSLGLGKTPPTTEFLDGEIARLTDGFTLGQWNYMIFGSEGGGTLDCTPVTQLSEQMVIDLRSAVRDALYRRYPKVEQLLALNTLESELAQSEAEREERRSRELDEIIEKGLATVAQAA
jgi:hypothetical protein